MVKIPGYSWSVNQTCMYVFPVSEQKTTVSEYLIVVFTDIGDIIAYKHGLHFCEEVYPYRNQDKV